MILSIDGIIAVVAPFVNLVTIASFLDMDVTTTKLYAKLPLVKIIFLFTFAYSVIPNKTACFVAVTMFSMIEVRNFVDDVIEDEDDDDDDDDVDKEEFLEDE